MTTLASIIIFILGAAIGSFLSVVIYRLQAKKDSIFFSRTMCPTCKKKIKWQHLIPVFSWLFLRGKCAYCREKISVHYLMMELATGLIFLITFLKFNFIISIPSVVNSDFLNYQINWQIFQQLIFYLVEFSLLIAIFFYDLIHKEIPDQLSLPAIAIALIGNLLMSGVWSDILNLLMGAAIIFLFFLIQFVLSKGTWIGGGDLRLGVLMGVILGWPLSLIALVITYLIGGIFSLILLLSGKVQRKSAIPFGPFIVTAIIITVFYGTQILDWYLNSLMV